MALTRWTRRTLPVIVRFSLARCASLPVRRQKASMHNLNSNPYYSSDFQGLWLAHRYRKFPIFVFPVGVPHKDFLTQICLCISCINSNFEPYQYLQRIFLSLRCIYIYFFCALFSPSSIDHFILPIFRRFGFLKGVVYHPPGRVIERRNCKLVRSYRIG